MYKDTIEKRLEELKTSKQGLSPEERSSRRQDHGYNEFTNLEERSIFSFLAESFKSYIQALLFMGFIFFAYLGSFMEAGIFLGIFVFRSLIKTYRDLSVQRNRLKFRKQNLGFSRVLEKGEVVNLAMRELIPGDIVLLKKGDIIPADGRLVEGRELYVDESILTGNKEPFCKDVSFLAQDSIPMGERANMVYASSLVCGGEGIMVVTATGYDTELGKVAFMILKDSDEKTVTETRVKKQSRIFNLLICILALALGGYAFFIDKGLLEVLFLTLSLLMATCLEGLSGLPQELEAGSVLKFANKGLAIKKGEVLEDLAGVSQVAFDLAPYLSQGQIKVKDISSAREDDERTIKKISLLLATKKDLISPEIQALREFALRENPDLDREIEGYEFIDEINELSGKGLYRAFYKEEFEGISLALGKSAEVLELCSHYGEDKSVLEMDSETLDNIRAIEEQFKNEGKDVLALAYRDSYSFQENNLVFLGLVSLGLAGNEGVKETIKVLKNAGIQPLMMSDHKAEEGDQLARELGFLIPGYELIDKEAFEALSDEELLGQLDNYTAYFEMNGVSRARLIEAWKAKGKRLAITCPGMDYIGGYSDAAVIVGDLDKSSPVVKEASDLLISSDNLSSFTEALAEARMYYLNIRRRMRFDLVLALALLISNFAILALFKEQAFSFMGLLWLGLVVKVLPGLALQKEARERNVLFRSPARVEKGPLTIKSIFLTIFEALLIALSVLAVFMFYPLASISMLNAMAYLVFGFGILLQAFGLRSAQWVLGRGFFSNRSFFAAFIISALLLVAPLLNPLSAHLLGLGTLRLDHWLMSLALAVIPLVITEARKIFIKE